MAATTPRPCVGPLFPAAGYDVVAMGVSEGGLAALTAVLTPLPATFPAALLIVRHQQPWRRSLLANLLAGRTPPARRQRSKCCAWQASPAAGTPAAAW